MLALGIIVATASLGPAVFSGCGADGAETATPVLEVLEVRGLVEGVQAESLISLSTFTIRDDSGMLWEFTAKGPLELSPSHMREHRALGLPVTVRYLETSEGLVAVELAD